MYGVLVDVPLDWAFLCCGPGEGSSYYVHEYGTPTRKRRRIFLYSFFSVEWKEKNASEYFVARETRSIFVRRSAKRKDNNKKKTHLIRMLLVIAFCVYHARRSKTRKLTYSHLKLTFRKVQTKRCIKLSITKPNTLTAPPPTNGKSDLDNPPIDKHHDRPQRIVVSTHFPIPSSENVATGFKAP